ncbi:hypothetical protein [Phenylobacterium sp.]|uniref:terminase small subunit-like protein n=1 Tax=Phenylobacterium sp. TaxID=1871053 RepID=UPI002DE5DC7D|nr:hypothetical protein [Phenylobacterium sp.]
MPFEVGAPGAPAGASLYSPELGREVCGRVAGGESLRSISATAGLPCRRTIRNWAAARPEFAEALASAQRAARLAARLRDRDARRGITVQGGRAASTYRPDIGETICRRIAEGASLVAICAEPGMPRASKVYDWLKANPGFEDMYVEARRRQADTLMDEVREVGLAATPKSVWADRLRFDTLRWLTARLAPKKYCEKIMVVEAMRAETEPQGMTVIVKRYCDVTPEEYARAEEGEP